MKITYIKLKNFANFFNCLKAKELSIDFTQMRNRILLLTGSNGSGKTSLLSTLHPFATNGTMDIRSDNPLILIGKEGYKEIHIEDKSNEYVIKHYYTPKAMTHTIKSYVYKNGVDLNPNGNVTSFKDIINKELDMEPEYLKLMRLGDNVTNFIDQKTTERKNYMGKILDDIDLFVKNYKIATTKIREIKTVISHLSDKISKLNITDIDEYRKMISSKEKRLNKISADLKELENESAIINHELSNFDNISINDIDRLIKKLENKLKISETKNEGIGDLSLDECVNLIDKTRNSINQLTNSEILNKELRENKLDILSDLSIEKNQCESDIQKSEINLKISSLKEERSDIKNRIDDIYKTHKSFREIESIPYSKSEIEMLVSVIITINELGDMINKYNNDALKRVIALREESRDVRTYINNGLLNIEKTRVNNEAHVIVEKFLFDLDECEPLCDNKCCTLYKFWNKYKALKLNTDINELEDEDFYDAMSIIHNNMTTIINGIENISGTINKLPMEFKVYFSEKYIYDNLVKRKEVINISIFNNLLADVTDWEYLSELKDQLSSINEKINNAKEISNVTYLENHLDSICSKINACNIDISSINDNLTRIKDELKEKTLYLSELEQFYDVLVHKDEILNEIDNLTTKRSEIKKLQDKLSTITSQITNTKLTRDSLNMEVTQAEYRISEYASLLKDFEKYKKKYDKTILVQRALSTKEGIPLKFIELYFSKTNQVTNDLLYSIYGDSLQIDDFVISADEFRIPYIVRNTTIPDVTYASQAEKSFISLALSFALLSQNLTRYNIMALDEVDGPFDTNNREMFLKILETQMDMVDGEQIFLISHNSMFDSIPVDVIDMNNRNRNEEIPLANYLKIDIIPA